MIMRLQYHHHDSYIKRTVVFDPAYSVILLLLVSYTAN